MNPVRRPIGRLAVAWLLLAVGAVVFAPTLPASAKDANAKRAAKGEKSAAAEPVAAAAEDTTPWWMVQDFWAHWLAGESAPEPDPAQEPATWGEVRSGYAQRGGTRGSSNPTTVPIVDGDLCLRPSSLEDEIGLMQAHALSRGAGQVVAVLDGGFNLHHPEIAGHISFLAYDAIDQDDDPQEYGPDMGVDDDLDGVVDGGLGHGTFVAGMILRVAPEATIVPVRIRDEEGWGTDLELTRGLEFALRIGADIVNISCESPHGHTGQVTRLLEQLRDRGTLVVVSAGNDAIDTVSELGDVDGTLVVGSTDAPDHVASFSNYTWDASRQMVFAPGVDLCGPYGFPTDESRAVWSGTSFSTALASGAAAVVRSFEPWMRPQDVINRLAWTADPVLTEDGFPLPFGHLNVGRAVLP